MISVILSVALVFSPADAHAAHETAARFVKTCTPREAGTIRGRIAANFILDEASKRGADVLRDTFAAMTPKGERKLTNLYGEFKADGEKPWVVLVSHFDTKPGVNCPGANDGASTTALLIALAGILSDASPLPGNVMLVWTDGEECFEEYGEYDGFWGSKRAAERLAARKEMNVRAVICLDMLGDADLRISIPANGTPTLAKIAVHAARRIGCPDLVGLMPEHVKDDHVAFLERGFKAIDLIDFEYGPGNSYWHTPDDTMDHVSEASLLRAGRLVTELLNILL